MHVARRTILLVCATVVGLTGYTQPVQRMRPTPTDAAQTRATPSPTPSIPHTGPSDLADPDVSPPIGVSHTHPVIARADETVRLQFSFWCNADFFEPGQQCHPKATLFVARDPAGPFMRVPVLATSHIPYGAKIWSDRVQALPTPSGLIAAGCVFRTVRAAHHWMEFSHITPS